MFIPLVLSKQPATMSLEEGFCGDLMSLAAIKRTPVFTWSARYFWRINQIWIFSTDLHKSPQYSTDICPVGAALIYAGKTDGRTEGQTDRLVDG